MKHPIPTDLDKEQIFKRLPCVKANLISDLKTMGWNEKWIRHLIWYLRVKTAEVYTYQGILKKV